jgi:hypothetical protein
MKQPFSHRSVSLLVVLVTGCATEERPANTLLETSSPAEGDSWLFIRNFLPESEVPYPNRVRVDGADMIIELDDGWEYSRFTTIGSGLGTGVPPGSHLVEILDLDGQQLVSATAEVVADPYIQSTTFIWGAHDAWSHVPDRPVATDAANVEIQSSLAVPVAVERCVDATCEVLGTIPPGGHFLEEVQLLVNPDPMTAASLQLRAEGDPFPYPTWISGLTAQHVCDRTLGVFLASFPRADGFLTFERTCF